MLRYSVAILQALVLVAGQGGGAPDCPCIEWAGLDDFIQGDLASGHLVYAPSGSSGPTYNYPVNYGNAMCKDHDKGLPPMCSRETPPGWCGQKWCYVKKDKCTLANIKTQFFKGVDDLYFSFETCTGSGGANSFSKALAASPDTAMDDLMQVMKNNLATVSEQIETAYEGIYNSATEKCAVPGTCPCKTCQSHAPWGGKSVDFSEVGASLATKGDKTVLDRASCLAKAIGDPYRKVAAVESDARGSRVGYQYYADQLSGSFVQWPAIQWCPRFTNTETGTGEETKWDPRLRPWYASAATGPKDVVIVVDVSGSMRTNDRYVAAHNATVAALNTLSWRDFASIVLFDDSLAGVYSETLTPVTEAERTRMQSWARGMIRPMGGTKFTAGLWKALKIIQRSIDEGKSSMCEKAILFLTDGQDSSWSASDYTHVKNECTKRGTTMFTYALGSGADTSITKQLACDNNGIFYKVPDAGDLDSGTAKQNELDSVMARYYEYFAAGTKICEPAWSRYPDPISKQDLYAACSAIYDRTKSNPTLLGASCMDANMVVDTNTLKGHSKWQEFVCSTSDVSKKCRANYLDECHKQRLRNAYSVESVCEMREHGIVVPDKCGCVESNCADDENFIDSKGYFCDTWVGDGCAMEEMYYVFKYGDAEANEIRQKCKKSCGLCTFLPAEQCSSKSSCESLAGPKCRPCAKNGQAKVSGNNIDGRSHCCSQGGQICPEAAMANREPEASSSNPQGIAMSMMLVMLLNY